MKHAFLVIAHNNWWQLKKLIQLLDDEKHDIYVHIDKKSIAFSRSEFEGITYKSNIQFFQEFKVYWGGYSQVEAEMLLLEKAHAVGYDYYHIISGADLPLKSNAELHRFFEANTGKEFIDFNENQLKNAPEIRRRTRLYHFLQNYRRRFKKQWINGCFTFLERASLAVQILLRVDRIKGLDWTIKYGSQWVSITNDLVKCVLSQKEKIERIFSFTNCADELFIQTIAFNCGFRDKVYLPLPGEFGNMRLIDWSRGKNRNPYTFRESDLEMLTSSNALFARKFSEQVDKSVIEKLCERLER